ncbi:MAG: phosphatidate cytidylyltransferase [Peptococcia bacterium]
MLRRVITSLIGVPLILICAYWGRVPFLLLVLVMVMTGIYEFYNLVLKFSSKTPLFLHIVGALIFPLTFYFAPDFAALFFFLFLLICYLYHLVHIEDFTPISLGLTILAVLYISYGFSHLLLLRSLENGFWLTFYVFITVWATDIGAYFVGINFGKHKLAPNISPKKTWEGFLGGLVASTIASLILVACVPLAFNRVLVIITPVISLGAQLGDLFESSLKRFAKTKDSGDLLPGHGGVLDRFDSLLWAAPLTYYLLIILTRYIAL